MPFDLQGTKAVLADVLAQERLKKTPQYQMQQAQFEQFQETQALMERASQAEDVGTFMKAIKTLRPELYMNYIQNQETQDKIIGALSEGNYTIARAMGYSGPQTPDEAGQVAKTEAGIQLETQEELYKKGITPSQISQTGQTQRDLMGNWTNISPTLIDETTRKPLSSMQQQKARRYYMKSGGELPQGVLQDEMLGKVSPLNKDALKDQRDRRDLLNLLGAIEKEFNALKPGEGVGGKLSGLGKTWLGRAGVGKFANYSSYSAAATGMGTRVARKLGDVGNIAQVEREINTRMLPKSTDNAEQGKEKLRIFKSLIEAAYTENEAGVDAAITEFNSTFDDKLNLEKNPETGKLRIAESTQQTTGEATNYKKQASDIVDMFEKGIQSGGGGGF